MLLLKPASVLHDDVQLLGCGVNIASGIPRATGGSLCAFRLLLVFVFGVQERLAAEAHPRHARRQRR